MLKSEPGVIKRVDPATGKLGVTMGDGSTVYANWKSNSDPYAGRDVIVNSTQDGSLVAFAKNADKPRRQKIWSEPVQKPVEELNVKTLYSTSAASANGQSVSFWLGSFSETPLLVAELDLANRSYFASLHCLSEDDWDVTVYQSGLDSATSFGDMQVWRFESRQGEIVQRQYSIAKGSQCLYFGNNLFQTQLSPGVGFATSTPSCSGTPNSYRTCSGSYTATTQQAYAEAGFAVAGGGSYTVTDHPQAQPTNVPIIRSRSWSKDGTSSGFQIAGPSVVARPVSGTVSELYSQSDTTVQNGPTTTTAYSMSSFDLLQQLGGWWTLHGDSEYKYRLAVSCSAGLSNIPPNSPVCTSSTENYAVSSCHSSPLASIVRIADYNTYEVKYKFGQGNATSLSDYAVPDAVGQYMTTPTSRFVMGTWFGSPRLKCWHTSTPETLDALTVTHREIDTVTFAVTEQELEVFPLPTDQFITVHNSAYAA